MKMDRRIKYFISYAVFLTILPSPVFSDSGGSLSGKRTPCSNENEEFSDSFLKNITNCFKCICKNGFVECDQETCPIIDDCYIIVKKEPGVCCDRCKECMFEGRVFEGGSEWLHPEEPCTHFKCLSGVVTESNLRCYTPCPHPKPPLPGQCCPTCLSCYVNGLHVQEGREVTLGEDPCVKCSCSDRRLTCVKRACPVLQCPLTKQIRLPGECCPKCTERIREVAPIPSGKCLLAKKLHEPNPFLPYNADLCSRCVCSNGTSICRRETCPILDCAEEFQVKHPHECCPQCQQVEETRAACSQGERVFQHNDTWQIDACQSCECRDGSVRCVRRACPALKCGPNEKRVTVPGECCQKCVENPGVCTVYGDPHYRTYDGYHYSFQGSCKYQLTADCVGQTFAIRVTNDARGTRHSAWTKTVTLKMGHLKINLGQKMRVKVNGTRVLQYPFQHEQFNVTKSSEEGITVETRLGIVLSWDGSSFLQVQVPVSYKGQLCGLCGNYDLSTRDELKTRDGRILSERSTYEFGNSWRVGGTKACARKRDARMAPGRWIGNRWTTTQKPVKVEKCLPLSGSDYIEDTVFTECQSQINSLKYFEACKMDMSECSTKFCYCDSFTAYAKECQRLGIELPGWRETTNCTLAKMLGRAQLAQREQNRKKQQQRRRHKGKASSLVPVYQLPDFSLPTSYRNPFRERTPPPIS